MVSYRFILFSLTNMIGIKMKIFLCIILILFNGQLFSQTISRIEPPNWWTGMKDPNLQIMLYGENIGNLKAKVKYHGVKLIEASCPENDNYLVIDLVIKKNTKAGSIPIELSDNDGHE